MITKIKDRQIKFEECRKNLKLQYFGIDTQLDNIMDSISAWYLTPELLLRPVIVNLWGLTGVGKTSVVRSLVNQLGFSPNYLELQLTGSEDTSFASILEESNIEDGKMGVILLDEFQRFRTVDSDNKDISTTSKLSDIWMLLSDGKFSSEGIYNALHKIRNLLEASCEFNNYKINKRNNSADDSNKETILPSDQITTLDLNWASHNVRIVKKHLKLTNSLSDIASIPNIKLISMIDDFLNTKLNNEVDYTKCLIFISGNLDEAFTVSSDVDDSDMDADILHEYTSKVSINKIKKSLTKRFRPEQIARMGNDHIIYPSLSRAAYEKLIRHNCGEYISAIEKLSGIEFNVDVEVYKTIYNNSVYPVQGTRPVFSTIQKIFTSPLSRGVLWCITNNVKRCKLSMDINPTTVTFDSGVFSHKIPINLDIDEQKLKYSEDYTALLAVHEAGHAIIYSELFKEAPKDIRINVASFRGGYNQFDSKSDNKKSMLNHISVCMGGIIAEEVIFGQDNRSSGCSSDVYNATTTASKYVRNYAMNGINGYVVIDTNTSCIQNTDESDKHIEEIITTQKKITQDIINKHKVLLVEMSKYLIENKAMSRQEFKLRYKDKFKFHESSHDIHGNYHELLMGQ